MKGEPQSLNLQLSRIIPAAIKNSIRLKLIAIVFAALFLLGAGTLTYNYYNELEMENQRINKHFTLVADMLKDEIIRWMDVRENDITTMAESPLVRNYIQQIESGFPNITEAEKELEDSWRKIVEQYAIYDQIYLVAASGEILASSEPTRKGEYRPRDDIINKPLETGKIFFQDAYLANNDQPCIAFSFPVAGSKINSGNGSVYAGVLVYRVNIEPVLQPMLESRAKLGSTGEIILVNEQRMPVTDLRQLPGSALNYLMDTETAHRVTRGEEGMMRGHGYLGQEQISVYRYLPGVHWGIIIRQDLDEIIGPGKARIQRVMLINILSMIIVLGIIYYSLSRVLKPVSAMAGVATAISRGDFSNRVEVVTRDEIGVLGETLNSMAGELGHQFKLQKNTQDVLETLVSTLELDSLLDKGLYTICEAFDYSVGAVFLAGPEKDILTRRAMYCPGRQLIDRPEEIRINEGMEGLAAITRQVKVISGLPEDTSYAVNWLGGEILPGSIMAVPLVFGDELLGVMSLASLNKITGRDAGEIKTIGALFGVAIYNSLSFEKTRRLSIRLQDLNEELAQQNEELRAQGEELASQGEELTAQNEELQALTEELQAQTEKLQVTTEELYEKNMDLEKLSEKRLKSTAALSHELRAPLNAVISFSDVLLDRMVGELNQQQEKYLQEIYSSGQHLLHLINDLLDFSRIEVGRIELNIRDIDPAAPLEEAIAMVSTEVDRKGLEMINNVARDTYCVTADHDRLRQVFLNLLSNAVKFTPDGGKITIEARSDNNVVSFIVSDTGIGIPREYHDIIFEEFTQAGNIHSKAFGGTGLGLAISRRLLELQGGNIHVESEEGKGAAFTFSLPSSSVVENSDSQNLTCDVDCPVEGECDSCNCPRAVVTYLQKPLVKASLLSNVRRVTCPLTGSRPIILVVDDDPAVRSSVADILKPRGYPVITAEDGQKGIAMALSHKPDIVILDIVMPGANGFVVLDEISRHHWEKGIAIFICTSKNLSMDNKKFIESRVKQIFSKKNIKKREPEENLHNLSKDE